MIAKIEQLLKEVEALHASNAEELICIFVADMYRKSGNL